VSDGCGGASRFARTVRLGFRRYLELCELRQSGNLADRFDGCYATADQRQELEEHLTENPASLKLAAEGSVVREGLKPIPL
jgi:hypothetical protein